MHKMVEIIETKIMHGKCFMRIKLITWNGTRIRLIICFIYCLPKIDQNNRNSADEFVGFEYIETKYYGSKVDLVIKFSKYLAIQHSFRPMVDDHSMGRHFSTIQWTVIYEIFHSIRIFHKKSKNWKLIELSIVVGVFASKKEVFIIISFLNISIQWCLL